MGPPPTQTLRAVQQDISHQFAVLYSRYGFLERVLTDPGAPGVPQATGPQSCAGVSLQCMPHECGRNGWGMGALQQALQVPGS